MYLSEFMYEGDMVKDKCTGRGTIQYYNFGTYVGEVQDLKRNGRGKLTRNDGKVYDEMWRNDKFLG